MADHDTDEPSLVDQYRSLAELAIAQLRTVRPDEWSQLCAELATLDMRARPQPGDDNRADNGDDPGTGR